MIDSNCLRTVPYLPTANQIGTKPEQTWKKRKFNRPWPNSNKFWRWLGYICITVGQRKKVTAVTFFLARPRPDQKGTNTQKRHKYAKFPCMKSRDFWYIEWTRQDLSWVQIMDVCLVVFREIWQFKLFAGKEVTAVLATRGEGGYWRRGRRLLCLCWCIYWIYHSKHNGY